MTTFFSVIGGVGVLVGLALVVPGLLDRFSSYYTTRSKSDQLLAQRFLIVGYPLLLGSLWRFANWSWVLATGLLLTAGVWAYVWLDEHMNDRPAHPSY